MGKDYREKALDHYEEKCRICNATESVVIHHIDGDHANSSIENLLPVCRSCHMKIHGQKEELSLYTCLIKDRSEREQPPVRSSTDDHITFELEDSYISRLKGMVDDQFISVDEAVRYFVRNGLQREQE